MRKKGFSIKNMGKKKVKKLLQRGDEGSSSSSDELEEVRATVPESYYKSNLIGSLNKE